MLVYLHLQVFLASVALVPVAASGLVVSATLHWFPGAVVTEDHNLGGLRQENFVSSSSGG